MTNLDRVRYCPNEDCPQLRRDGTPAEYRAHIELCAECGATLVVDRIVPGGTPAHETLDRFGTIDPAELLTTVAIFHEPVALQHAAERLETRGIPFLVSAAHASVMFGSSSAVQQRLQVPRSHEDEATQLLAAEGLALRRPHPERSAAVRELERQEHRRTGLPPFFWLFLWLGLLGLWYVLRRG